MSEFQPYFTNDGSVGLYSEKYDDIYHSASGALTEAYEKFIYPINWDVLLMHDNIKILDICYGIGYNSKSFLNFVYENQKKLLKKKKKLKNFSKNNFLKSYNIETIHTNNKYTQNSGNYINPIYTDNIFNNLSITAIDNDEILIGLSPFIKSGVKNIKNNSEIKNKHNISKYLTEKNTKKPKIKNFLNFLILSKITQNAPNIYQNPIISTILTSAKYSPYLNSQIKGLYTSGCVTGQFNLNNLNLHNIYYRYLSNCYKNDLKRFKIRNIDFNIKINDARNAIMSDSTLYNLIFLDAFTPQKCPCLWSYDFFKELYRVLNSDGMLLTYSSSAVVRSAMQAAGFYIGYIYSKRFNKSQGTIAAKNEALINYPLSEDDLGLLNTRAGIFYRDKNLNAQNEAIIKARNFEVQNSDKISSSKYLKMRSNNEV